MSTLPPLVLPPLSPPLPLILLGNGALSMSSSLTHSLCCGNDVCARHCSAGEGKEVVTEDPCARGRLMGVTEDICASEGGGGEVLAGGDGNCGSVHARRARERGSGSERARQQRWRFPTLPACPSPQPFMCGGLGQ